MATDAFNRTIPPATGVTPDWRGMIEDFSASVFAPIPVANTTARAALVSAITAAGYTISATQPVFVLRADASAGRSVEFTTDGTTWASLVSTGGSVSAMGQVQVATSSGASIGAGGGTLGATSTIVIASRPWAQVVTVHFAALATALTPSSFDAVLRDGAATVLARARAVGANTTAYGSYATTLAAGSSLSLQQVVTATGAATITSDSSYTYLWATAMPVS